MPVVYIDVLFGVNFLLNTFLIFSTGYILKLKLIWWRIVLGGIVGGLYCVIILFPELKFAQVFIFKLIVSLLMIVISYSSNFRGYLKILGTFYIATFVFAGIVLGVVFMQGGNVVQQNGVFYFKLPFLLLVLSILVGCGLLFNVGKLIIRKFSMRDMYKDVCIKLKDKQIILKGLVDTGNNLFEPITRLPVLIVNPKKICGLLTNEQIKNIENLGQTDVMIYILPCSTISSSGSIIGFKPDQLTVDGKIYNAIVGLSNNFKNEEYQVLINPGLLSMEVHDEVLREC